MLEPLYQVKIDCIHCEASFETSRVRPSFKVGGKRDADFCMHYKDQTVNPDYYVVRVCPYCGFASTENFLQVMSDLQKRTFQSRVSEKWAMTDYGGERSWDDAMNAYKLALVSAQIKEEKPRIVAGILHHIAWLYRFVEDRDNEERFLAFALDAYIKVYETESTDVNHARLMFLIGELSRRLRKYHEAVRWFSRVINDKKIMDAGMIQASREQWVVVREDMAKENMTEAEIERLTEEAQNEAIS